jgi:hypothetical protein
MDSLLDATARALASLVPRRKALKALGRIVMGSIVAGFGVREAAASCGQLPGCNQGYVCCSLKCVIGAICCGTRTCAAQYACVSGNCVSST